MIPKIICFLIGHKIVIKSFAGQVALVDGVFDKNIRTPIMHYERLKFCLRCGKQVLTDDETRATEKPKG